MVTVVELRKKCKELKLKGYSKLKKSQLEDLLKGHALPTVTVEKQKKDKPKNQRSDGRNEVKFMH